MGGAPRRKPRAVHSSASPVAAAVTQRARAGTALLPSRQAHGDACAVASGVLPGVATLAAGEAGFLADWPMPTSDELAG
jgi:hypothetical protein